MPEPYVSQKFGGRHARHDEQVAQDDSQIGRPARAQLRPDVLQFFGMVVPKFDSDVE